MIKKIVGVFFVAAAATLYVFWPKVVKYFNQPSVKGPSEKGKNENPDTIEICRINAPDVLDNKKLVDWAIVNGGAIDGMEVYLLNMNDSVVMDNKLKLLDDEIYNSYKRYIAKHNIDLTKYKNSFIELVLYEPDNEIRNMRVIACQNFSEELQEVFLKTKFYEVGILKLS